MLKYLGKRFFQLVVVAFVISVLVFLLVRILPGSPAQVILGSSYTPQAAAQLNAQLGLNHSLIIQYWDWILNIFHGNFGQSYINNETVANELATGAPIDLELIILSQIVAFAVSIPLALTTSRRPNRWFDNVSTTGTFGMLALPPFVIAPIMVAIFAVNLKWFPATGEVPFTQAPLTNLHDFILPSLAITAGSIAVYYRLLRSDLIATLQEDFITMARSKGLSNRTIMLRHAFRPSTFSLMAAAGINIGGLLAGTFIVEYLFAIPGLGYTLVVAVNQRDYLVVQGITLVVALAYVVLQFIIDFLFTVVDPRVIRE